MISLSVDVTKIPKDKIKVKPTGKYLDLVLFDKPDIERGNDGFVAVSVSKEERERGERGPILGNWRHIGQKPTQEKRVEPRKPAPAVDDWSDEGDSVPF